MSDQHVIALEPFAVTPKTARQIEQCGITELYRRINAGEYETYLDGGKRMITMRSINARRERKLAEANGPPSVHRSRKGGGGRPPQTKDHTHSRVPVGTRP